MLRLDLPSADIPRCLFKCVRLSQRAYVFVHHYMQLNIDVMCETLSEGKLF